MMNPELSSSVSVVKLNENVIEFFLTNIRHQVRLKVEDDTIFDIVNSLDGTRTEKEIAEEYNVDNEDLHNLLEYLRFRGILDNTKPHKDFESYGRYRRIIHFLAEYSHSHEHLISMWDSIRSSVVLVVGLGAVGTWVAVNLAQSGVGTIILMDGDVVDVSNLHRQFGFTEEDIGKKKVDVLEERIHAYSGNTKVIKEYNFLNGIALHTFDGAKVDLIINCADQPTVDETSLWVGEYAMKRGISHIVGGGYNLHLSLIGQTVVPGRTACLKCFQTSLNEENVIDPAKVKKLNIKNRKVGSFGPMCSVIASMVGMEAIKVLSGSIQPSNINRRGEFDVYTMDISYKEYLRRDDCEWCGKDGKYYRS